MPSEQRDVFRLYLLRHAHAAWPAAGSRDFDRPLDAKGTSEARNVALQAYTAGLWPEGIVSSPARRCVETSAAFIDIFGHLPAEYDEQLYSCGLDAYLDQIRKHQSGQSLLLVGHNPMIESLAVSLCGQSGSALAHGYPTAGLLALDFDRPRKNGLLNGGHIALMLTPALT